MKRVVAYFTFSYFSFYFLALFQEVPSVFNNILSISYKNHKNTPKKLKISGINIFA